MNKFLVVQNFKMTNGTDGTINSFNLWYSLKRLFFSKSFGQLSSEETVGNNKLRENVVYKELQNNESNDVYDLFEEREYAIGCVITCAVNEKAP